MRDVCKGTDVVRAVDGGTVTLARVAAEPFELRDLAHQRKPPNGPDDQDQI